MEQQRTTERDFCAWMRRARVAQDLTQEALAEVVGCATQTVRSFENGRRRPSRELAARLANVLQVPEDERALFIRLARAPLAEPTAEDQPDSGPLPLSVPPRPPVFLPADALIGRHADLQRLRHAILADRRRLVTIFGPGGIGKTRLALQAAADLAAQFDDGAAVVSLAAIVDPADVVTTVAAAVGCPPAGGQPPERALLAFLSERAMLLVLDNLEHLLSSASGDQASRLLADILHEAPDVAILCTSRERLRLRAESIVEIDGLALPPDDRPGAIERAEATLLFLERARQVTDTFALTAENRAAIARICRLLEGVPLGIELAAAWVRVMSPVEIADEMARGILFLELDDRDLPPRHRSIRAVIEQSWQLLTDDERRLLLRLAVFRGGFRREAVEPVCVDAVAPDEAGARGRPGALLSVLSGLVDKSRLRRSADHDGATRYDLHEVLRQYLVAQLAGDAAAEAEAQRRHAAYYVGWLASQDGVLKSARQNEALRAITAEMGNVRTAWRWAARQQDAAMLRRMAETLHWFYEVRGWHGEGVSAFGAGAAALRAAAESESAASERRAAYWLLVTLEGWHAVRSDPARAIPLLTAGLAGQRQADDPWALALCLVTVAYVRIFVGDYVSAEALLDENEEIAGGRGYTWVLSVGRVVRGVLETLRRDPETARQHLHRALLTARAVGDPRHVALTLNYLGLTALGLGHVDEAERVCRECLAIAQQHQDRFQTSLVLQSLGRVALARGALAEGEALLDEGLAIARELGDHWLEAEALGSLAQLAGARDDTALARAYQRAAVQSATAAPQPIALDQLAALAELELTTQPDAALAALAYVRQHPLSRPAVRERAERHWRDSWRQLPPERCLAAEAAVRSFPQDQPGALLSLFGHTPELARTA